MMMDGLTEKKKKKKRRKRRKKVCRLPLPLIEGPFCLLNYLLDAVLLRVHFSRPPLSHHLPSPPNHLLLQVPMIPVQGNQTTQDMTLYVWSEGCNVSL